MVKVILHTFVTWVRWQFKILRNGCTQNVRTRPSHVTIPCPSRVLAGWGGSLTVRASSVPTVSGGWRWQGLEGLLLVSRDSGHCRRRFPEDSPLHPRVATGSEEQWLTVQ